MVEPEHIIGIYFMVILTPFPLNNYSSKFFQSNIHVVLRLLLLHCPLQKSENNNLNIEVYYEKVPRDFCQNIRKFVEQVFSSVEIGVCENSSRVFDCVS